MTEHRLNNTNVLPSCHDCIACQERDVAHCQLLIRLGLCRLMLWMQNRGLEPVPLIVKK